MEKSTHFILMFKIIETFVLRRAVYKFNALNQYLPTVYGSLDHENLAES